MIGIISMTNESFESSNPPSSLFLPDNLQEAANWKFKTVPTAKILKNYNQKPSSGLGSNIEQRVSSICKHLKEGIAYLDAQEKALHEVTHSIQGIGELVNHRDGGFFPRKPEAHLEAEFQLLLHQIEALRGLTHFNKPLFGNAGSAPLKIYTSLSDVPRYELVHLADLEALHLRMIYWGRVAGDGTKALISREVVDFALTHLLEVTLKNQKEMDRLKHVYQEYSRSANSESTDSETSGSQESPHPHMEAEQESQGFITKIKDKLLKFKGSTEA
jgi:hypothetical protein